MAGFAAARWYLDTPENHLPLPLQRHVGITRRCSKQSRLLRRALPILPPSALTATAHLQPLAQPTVLRHPGSCCDTDSHPDCRPFLTLIVAPQPRTEPVTEPEKVGLVDGVQHLDCRTLDDLVFQRRHADYLSKPIDHHATFCVYSLWRVAMGRQSGRGRPSVLEMNTLRTGFARYAPRLSRLERSRRLPSRSLPYCRHVTRSTPGAASRLRRKYASRSIAGFVDVVQERGEPQRPIPSRCLTYPLQRTERARPAQCPGRVLLVRIPFGQAPFLHPLRGPVAAGRRDRRFSLGCIRRFRLRARVGFTIAAPPAAAPVLVRGVPRYYGPVRLPSSVHRRRTSLDFPTRPAAPSATGEAGISRLPRKVFPYVPGVCDRAGSRSASRYRRPGCGLPPPPKASAPRSNLVSRLDTRPARTPVNASPPLLRATAHDSGPPWVAIPSTYDSLIHNNLAGFCRRTGGQDDTQRAARARGVRLG